MPTYLIHGFRWSREPIRIHIIQQDLEDAASEWIVAPATSVALLNSFYTLYDFLPPSSPPFATYPVLAQPTPSPPATSPNRLLKKNTGTRGSPKSSLSFRPGKERPGDLNTTEKVIGRSNGRQVSPSSRPLGSSKSTSDSSTSTTTPEKGSSFNDWSVVKLLEEYDPDDMTTTNQKYAYVGDYMLRIDLAIDIADEINKYEAIQRADEVSVNNPAEEDSKRTIRRRSKRLGWFEKLRDGLQKSADIGWYVVVCGDEEREVGSVGGDPGEESGEEVLGTVRTPKSAGLKGFFGRKEKKIEE